MIHYHKLGSIPPKHHVTHYEDGKLLREQCFARIAFVLSTLWYIGKLAARSRSCDRFSLAQVRPLKSLIASSNYTLKILLLCLASPLDLSAQDTRRIAQDVFGSVVLLTMEDRAGQPLALASGFFVKDSVIVTNLHVIEGASAGHAKLVGKDQTFRIAGVVGVDDKRDLVLLALRDAKARPLPLGDSSRVAVGDSVYAVGNPRGLEGTFSEGIISGIRKIDDDTVLQITAPVSPGSSGGPVLNRTGAVIGVAVATFRQGQNLNFAVPSNYITALLQQTSEPQPLRGKATRTERPSLFADLEVAPSNTVVGTLFQWGYYAGTYSFTLRNNSEHSVKNVTCLIIFLDKDGEPIETVISKGLITQATIPPKLAKRVTHLSVHSSVYTLSKKVEIRVLDFEISE